MTKKRPTTVQFVADSIIQKAAEKQSSGKLTAKDVLPSIPYDLPRPAQVVILQKVLGAQKHTAEKVGVVLSAETGESQSSNTAAPTYEAALKRVEEVIVEIYGIDYDIVVPATSVRDVCDDEVAIIAILNRLEKEFHFIMSRELILNLTNRNVPSAITTIEDLARFVVENSVASSAPTTEITTEEPSSDAANHQ